MHKIILAALAAMTIATAASAEPATQKLICILWDPHSGAQLFAEKCDYQEWDKQFRVIATKGGSKKFAVTVNTQTGVADGLIGPYAVNSKWRWDAEDYLYLWPNGRPALSIEDADAEG